MGSSASLPVAPLKESKYRTWLIETRANLSNHNVWDICQTAAIDNEDYQDRCGHIFAARFMTVEIDRSIWGKLRDEAFDDGYVMLQELEGIFSPSSEQCEVSEACPRETSSVGTVAVTLDLNELISKLNLALTGRDNWKPMQYKYHGDKKLILAINDNSLDITVDSSPSRLPLSFPAKGGTEGKLRNDWATQTGHTSHWSEQIPQGPPKADLASDCLNTDSRLNMQYDMLNASVDTTRSLLDKALANLQNAELEAVEKEKANKSKEQERKARRMKASMQMLEQRKAERQKTKEEIVAASKATLENLFKEQVNVHRPTLVVKLKVDTTKLEKFQAEKAKQKQSDKEKSKEEDEEAETEQSKLRLATEEIVSKEQVKEEQAKTPISKASNPEDNQAKICSMCLAVHHDTDDGDCWKNVSREDWDPAVAHCTNLPREDRDLA